MQRPQNQFPASIQSLTSGYNYSSSYPRLLLAWPHTFMHTACILPLRYTQTHIKSINATICKNNRKKIFLDLFKVSLDHIASEIPAWTPSEKALNL